MCCKLDSPHEGHLGAYHAAVVAVNFAELETPCYGCDTYMSLRLIFHDISLYSDTEICTAQQKHVVFLIICSLLVFLASHSWVLRTRRANHGQIKGELESQQIPPRPASQKQVHASPVSFYIAANWLSFDSFDIKESDKPTPTELLHITRCRHRCSMM